MIDLFTGSIKKNEFLFVRIFYVRKPSTLTIFFTLLISVSYILTFLLTFFNLTPHNNVCERLNHYV